MPKFEKSKGFQLKSGNKPGFKMMGASPYKKPLVGNQDNLPEHLQQKILDSPAKQKGKVTKKVKMPDFASPSTVKGITGGNAKKFDKSKVKDLKASPAKQKVYGGPDSDSDDPKEIQREKERAKSLKIQKAAKAAGKGAVKAAKKSSSALPDLQPGMDPDHAHPIKQTNPKEFARRQKLKAGKTLKSEHPDVAMPGDTRHTKIDDLNDRIEFIKENAFNEDRSLSNAEKADITSMKNRVKKL